MSGTKLLLLSFIICQQRNFHMENGNAAKYIAIAIFPDGNGNRFPGLI
jgi:hypothetical protein